MKCGGHWNPHNKQHGGRNDDESHAGDLGNITANEKKIANFRFTTSKLTLFGDVEDSIVGRSIVIHKDEDDNGKLNMVMGFYPSEATGASNNAQANFGPPKWKNAKFEVKNGQVVKQHIKL